MLPTTHLLAEDLRPEKVGHDNAINQFHVLWFQVHGSPKDQLKILDYTIMVKKFGHSTLNAEVVKFPQHPDNVINLN